MDQRELVRQCLKGKPSAQKALYDLFAPDMLAVCYRYTKSMADAEDVLQEGFVKAFLALEQYRAQGELGGWIRRIMVNTALNYLKRKYPYNTDLSFGSDHLHPVSQENPEVRLHAKELADLIRQLPTGYQTIFNLYAVEGFSHAEIGTLLGISEGTSRSQYARARALLITWIQRSEEHPKTQSYAGK
ncbi:RNA polymerase sigma factor [Flaviaesturariibacter amylovorans]|uniref:Sigma-70 family RNA polymerase sigma factor n=1 Tax=Flaviaesturariibacter amylovorans TaxID=1084520 RepID=A0ABP8GGU4_9BACT